MIRRVLGRLARHDLAAPIALALCSRAMVVMLLVGLQAVATGLRDALSVFAAWDGWWYAHIAMSGYHATPVAHGLAGQPLYDIAFFPGWPALLSIVSLGGRLPLDLVGGMLANALFVAAIAVAYRAFAPRFGRQATLWGLAFLAFTPAAYTFSLAYTESLFLLLAALALQPAASVGRRTLCAVAASATRLVGPAVSLLALAGPLRERRRPTLAEAVLLVAGPLTLVAWFAAIALITGDPTGYLRGTPSFFAGQDAPFGFLGLLSSRSIVILPQIALGLGMPLVGLALLVRRRDIDLALFSCGTLLPLLVSQCDSMPRYALAALPAWVVLGTVLAQSRHRRPLLFASALVMALQTFMVVAGRAVP